MWGALGGYHQTLDLMRRRPVNILESKVLEGTKKRNRLWAETGPCQFETAHARGNLLASGAPYYR